MSANRIQSLRKIIKKLSPQELETTRSYISSFNRKFGNYTPKTLQLFDALCDNTKNYTVLELQNITETCDNTNTFTKLISRLQEKVYESLTLEINLKRSNNYSKSIISLYTLRKNTISAQILYTRGLVKESLELIRKSEKTALTYHYYNELFALMGLKLIVMNYNYGGKAARQVEKDIAHYKKLRAVFEKSELYFNSLVYRERKQANSKTYLSELRQRIDDLSQDPHLPYVNVAQYYLGQMKTHYLRLQNDNVAMEASSHELLELMNRSPELQSRPRMANAYKNLADASLFIGQFEEARKFGRKTQEYLIPFSQNYFEMELFFFRTHFYENDFEKALQRIKHIIQLRKTHPVGDAFYSDQLNYFHAYTLFMKSKYKEANQLLLSLNELSNDKGGWYIGTRILQILIRIGQKEFSKADPLVEALYQYISAPSRKKDIVRRDQLIGKLLYRLMRNDYDYRRTALSSAEILKSLRSKPATRWQYFTPELTPVDTWLETLK